MRPNKDRLDPANINMIMEFMQVPQQVFTEPLFKIDRKQQLLMAKAELQNIEEDENEYDENSQYMEPQSTPMAMRKPETRMLSANPA